MAAFDFSRSGIGGYPNDSVASVPIDYATGGYTQGDVARIQREQLMRDQREQVSFLAYLNALANGAPQEQLAQINPIEHQMRTGDRYMPVGDEMHKIGNGPSDIKDILRRTGLRKDLQTKTLEDALSGLSMTQDVREKQRGELWKRTPLQMAMEGLSADDAVRAALVSLNVPQFFGRGDIPSKYQHELDIEEKKGEKVKEATKLGYAKLGEQGIFHQGTLANAASRTNLLGQGQQDDLTAALLSILQKGGGDILNPNAKDMNSQFMELIAEVLANRQRPQVSGPGMNQPGGNEAKQGIDQLVKQLNSQHSSAAIGSTTSVPVGGQTVQFIKTRTGWKVQQ